MATSFVTVGRGHFNRMGDISLDSPLLNVPAARSMRRTGATVKGGAGHSTLPIEKTDSPLCRRPPAGVLYLAPAIGELRYELPGQLHCVALPSRQAAPSIYPIRRIPSKGLG